MTDSTERPIDRYARGELTAAEARELAQKSLGDRELFEDLTYAALAKAALSAPSVRERLAQADARAKIVRFPGKAWGYAGGAVAAAAVVLVLVYSRNPSHETATVSRLKPVLSLSAKPGEPVLLASGLLAAPAGLEGAPLFRGPEPGSRSPRPAGSILSIEDGLATIDLGSLDGLAKGRELRVFRDDRSTQPIGRLMVTTVFRERARGRILAGREMQVNHRVRVAGADHLDALLEQVDALDARGDAKSARAMAEKAAGWAETADVPADERRKAWERLATLEYRAGSLQAAEQHYRSAVDSLTAEPTALNNLAVLRLLNGDYDGAEAPLNQAVAKSAKTDAGYGRSVNNLGVLAELRGDRRKAEALYTDAMRALAGGPERSAVEANLARLRTSR